MRYPRNMQGYGGNPPDADWPGGAKVAVTLAVIGAVIGEFVGSSNGLGNLLLTANSQLETSLAWAALVWLSALGILLFAAVALAERLLAPWTDAALH